MNQSLNNNNNQNVSVVRYHSDESELADNFFKAAERKDYNMLKTCLDEGIDPNIRNNVGWTALHVCAADGDATLVEYLAQLNNIKINVKSANFRMAPLHLAVRNERARTVDVLLRYNADPNVVNRNGYSSLHIAVITENELIVKLLLKMKANVNALNVFSQTPLSLAILDKANFYIAKILLQYKADPNMDRPNNLPLMCQIVLHHDDDLCIQLLNILIFYGIEVNVLSEIERRNAVHFAAIRGSEKVGKFLKETGCNIYRRDLMNRLPYDIAILHNNRGFAKIVKPEIEEPK